MPAMAPNGVTSLNMPKGKLPLSRKPTFLREID